MTNAEADALIATLPKPGGLQLYREGDEIVMAGGRSGAHSIRASVSPAERLLIHWKGYVENNGQTLGPGYSPAQPPRPASQIAVDYQPGDRISFYSPSYSAAKGWRPGKVVRTTPKRVLVEYSFKYDLEQARKTGESPRQHQIWKKRSEVRTR